MQEQTDKWLAEKMMVPGVIACGIRFADQRTVARSSSNQHAPAAIENVCHCLSETFQTLNANHFSMEFVRWVYENHFLYGAVRPDGHCLAIMTRRKSYPVLQQKDLEQILAEFQGLEA